MKTTGIVRNLDPLGRIVIPKEMRKTLDIAEKDPVDIRIEGASIVMKKYEPSDIFTGETKGLIEYHGKMVSKKTIKELASIAGLI